MTFLSRIFGDRRERARLAPLYAALVGAGRDPAWYREGRVPDTLDGRFDMIAALLSLLLVRLERDGEGGARAAVLLTESFIDDMDASLRQIGIGDFAVGKHVGRMMGALGGRLAAFRAASGDPAALADAVARNIYRGDPPSPEAAAFVAAGLKRFEAELAACPTERLLLGELKGR